MSVLTVTKPNTKVLLLLVFFVGCSFVFVIVMNRSSRERQKPPRPQVTPLKLMKHTNEDILQQKRNKLFQLPVHQITLPFNKLVRRTWYKDLESFLLTLSINEVTLLSASSTKYIPDLLNWLSAYRVATGSSLSEVLVVSMNLALHNTLIDNGFNSIFIENEDLFLPGTKTYGNRTAIWIKRITAARIINHLGFHVMMMDLDAIILKDITSLIEQHRTSDIVGSMGTFPPEIGKVWGFTLCMGAVLFRSTPGTEKFWHSVSTLTRRWEDDQMRINYGLKALDINWTQDKSCVKAHTNKWTTDKCIAKGETGVEFAITLLSQYTICRNSACHYKFFDVYYIWHNHFSKGQGPLWFLKNDWKNTLEKHRKSADKRISQLIDQITRNDRYRRV